jgi:DNA-binding GntR family transcriptional regulator
VHRELSEQIRSVRRLDFSLQDRIQATYAEHAYILRAVVGQQVDVVKNLLTSHIQASQLQVRNITLHQIHQARRSL